MLNPFDRRLPHTELSKTDRYPLPLPARVISLISSSPSRLYPYSSKTLPLEVDHTPLPPCLPHPLAALPVHSRRVTLTTKRPNRLPLVCQISDAPEPPITGRSAYSPGIRLVLLCLF